ncbi:MAG: hypothetical protein DRH90_15365 [Deltaproteobacteria bacterium]|nr:MAG: hypothetical protein DRH90_15365 [Deltaproteobacteria bacterium]
MRWFSPLLGIVLFLSIAVGPSAADDTAGDNPWATFSFNGGLFASRSQTDVRFGAGLGVEVNLEDALGMESETQVFRLESYWRFTDNRKHRADFSWFSLHRTAFRKITEDITVQPPEGDPITIIAGTEVSSKYNMDILQLNYSYSFIQDDRLDLAGGVGLYIMPISLGIEATGLVDEQADQSFTAPLPALGLRMDILLAPKWYFRGSTQLFYLEYKGYTGSLTSTRTAVEYNPWTHVGLGLGMDAMRMSLEANDPDSIPGLDLRGNVDFNYIGLYLYGRVFF